MLARQWYITILAMLGLFVSVIVRELCIANDADDFEGNVKCGEKAPHVQFFKASCSALTAFQVYLMLKQMELKTEHADTKESLRRRSRGLLLQNSKSSSDGLAQRMLRFLGLNGRLIFVLLPLNIIHPVPGLSFIVSVEQLGVVTSYRVESLILAVMLFRVYHVFVLYKLRLLATLLCLDATLIIRNDSTIRQLNDPRMSKPQLAFKIALHRQPFTIILILWVTIILTATWAIRVFEMNTSQSFSTYVWDQMWMIIVIPVFVRRFVYQYVLLSVKCYSCLSLLFISHLSLSLPPSLPPFLPPSLPPSSLSLSLSVSLSPIPVALCVLIH
jgi:hypothetical protein